MLNKEILYWAIIALQFIFFFVISIYYSEKFCKKNKNKLYFVQHPHALELRTGIILVFFAAIATVTMGITALIYYWSVGG